MGATAAAVVTTRPGRIRYDHYETVPCAAGSCPMCGAATQAHVPHACAKPDFDHPPHAVRARHRPLECLYFPFLLHPGLLWRFEARVYRCADARAHFVQSRENFFALVEAGIFEEVQYANA